MVSIHYRLLSLHYDMGSVDETIRLAMLAFASTIFLQWRGVKTPYKYLAENLKRSLILLGHENLVGSLSFTLWLYLISAISVFDDHDQSFYQPILLKLIQDWMGEVEKNPWETEMVTTYKSVLWLDAVHDLPAKQIVDATLRTCAGNSWERNEVIARKTVFPTETHKGGVFLI